MDGTSTSWPAVGKGPLDLSDSGIWHVAKATWREVSADNLGLIASGVAFMVFLAFVPLLVAVVLTYGLVASPERVANDIALLSKTMPDAAATIISSQLRHIVALARSTAGLGLLVALLVSLYGAMKAASGLITALNIVFGIKETRSLLRVTLLSLAITLGLVLAFVVASLGLSVVNFLASFLPDLAGAVNLVVHVGYWLATAVAISLIIATIYRLAPDRSEGRWRWITPGSVLATIVWVLATLAFSYYVRSFGSYNATYGSLAAVVIFLTWLYLTAYIVLIGAELNYVLERRSSSLEA
jgi:membrane protein